MTALTNERFLVIMPSAVGGTEVRTTATRKEMITDLILNSGEEIALWAEGEAKRCADKWRAFSTAAECLEFGEIE